MTCVGTSDKLHGGIVENLILGLYDFDARKSLCETSQLVLLAAPRSYKFSAAALDGADHAVDVVMAHAAHGKLNVILRLLARIFCLHSVFNDAAASGVEGCGALGQARHHCYRTKGAGLPQKVAPVKRSAVHQVLSPTTSRGHRRLVRIRTQVLKRARILPSICSLRL